MKKVVILLPTFNERENIEKFINDVFEQQINCPGWKFEILVVDSNSPDNTLEVVKKLQDKNENIHTMTVGLGLGVAIIQGHKYAIKNYHPDVLAQLDADSQVDASVLPKLLKVIDEGYDFAIGSRFVKGGKNQLTLLRRIFTAGASFFCRIIMGPSSIKEFTNSARAFTPKLFQKMNINRIPWRERTFIIQPAFLNEAILAGAKYKEIPLVFKDRLEGYSKNKVFNYTYDVITYIIEARLRKWGFNIPFFYYSRRAKTLVKFGLVGFIGTLVDFLFYKIFINIFSLTPATSKGFSAEMAIINNFVLNNFWTFKYRKTTTNIWQKFGIFNLVSLGGLVIGVLVVKFLHSIYGDGFVWVFGRHIAYNNFYFFATIPPVMIWNFLMNHFVTWKHKED